MPDRIRLEIHEHCFIRGDRARMAGAHLRHSHPGGEIPHHHPGTGPAYYTVDRNEWEWRTGLLGGGTKKYTARPSGEQIEYCTEQ